MACVCYATTSVCSQCMQYGGGKRFATSLADTVVKPGIEQAHARGYREGHDAFRREMVEALGPIADEARHYDCSGYGTVTSLREKLLAGTFPPKPKEGT